MSRVISCLCGLLFLLSALLLAANPPPARAFSPAVPPWLWEDLKEGQQIAVITLRNVNTARIEVFTSILDKTNESHEVIFFIPLGEKATDFYAVEQDVLTFDEKTTSGLDSILEKSARDRQQALHALFAGTLLTNGALLAPLWTPILLTGCATPATPVPEATFQTESSQISIYDIDENADIEELINTTGLQSSVQETLARLRGQQIAVVKLQTHPPTSSETTRYQLSREPGIRLSWTTKLVAGESGNTYSYPLGTGASWSKPIELTRVYIVAPTGIDFDVRYPALGSEQSGYNMSGETRISDFYQVPAYAIEDARGSFGRVWRVTYTQSNPTEDITIVAKQQTTLSKMYANMAEASIGSAFAFAVILGLAFWMLSWHFLMPRFLGKKSQPNDRLQWHYGLIYPGINAGLIFIPGAALYAAFSFGFALQSLVLLFLILSGAIIAIFMKIHAGNLGVSKDKALRAFVLTSLVSNGAYLVFASIYAKLSGLI